MSDPAFGALSPFEIRVWKCAADLRRETFGLALRAPDVLVEVRAAVLKRHGFSEDGWKRAKATIARTIRREQKKKEAQP